MRRADLLLRICLVCAEYPPDTIGGGIGTYTANIARGLARAGHKISVVAQAVRGTETTVQEDGVCIYRVLPPHMRGLSRTLQRYGDGKTFADAYLHARAVASKVLEMLEKEGLDVVQSPEHGAEGFVLAMNGSRIPHVVRFHTPLIMVNQAVGNRLSLGGRIVHVMERTTARWAVLNTCASHALAEIVASRFGIPLDRIRIVPNCVDTEAFEPASSVSAHPLTVLYVGKVAPLKGSRVLLEAIPGIIRRVPEVKVLIVGSDHPANGMGSSKAEMLARFQQAGVASSVTFLPLVERTHLVRLYREADVCMLPTLWDNFPNTCLEAMACGVPVVATAVGGLPEIIDGGADGVLVPANDPTRFADEVVGLLEHPERRLVMGRAARTKILSRYTAKHVVAATVAVYEEAIERSATKASTR